VNVTYFCIRCFEEITERVRSRRQQLTRGICKTCTLRILQLKFADREAVDMDSITLPVSNSKAERPAPPAGRKYCACGCGETLPSSAYQIHIRGHRKRMRDSATSSPNGNHLQNSILELQSEIRWREARQKEIEQEVGVNRQKLLLLRQALQGLEVIQGGQKQ
jgi:hypothetical protein